MSIRFFPFGTILHSGLRLNAFKRFVLVGVESFKLEGKHVLLGLGSFQKSLRFLGFLFGQFRSLKSFANPAFFFLRVF